MDAEKPAPISRRSLARAALVSAGVIAVGGMSPKAAYAGAGGAGGGVGAPPNIIGFSVDLAAHAATLANMQAATGVQWSPVRTATAEMRRLNAPNKTVTFTFAMSVTGPPNYAVESADIYPYNAVSGRNLFRLIYVVADAATASAQLSATGLWPLIVTVEDGQPDGEASQLAIHEGIGKTLVEVIDARAFLLLAQ